MKDLQRQLSEYIPISWRVQQANEHGANCVCYIDARDAMERLDKVFGVSGWQRDQKEVKGRVYGGVGILVDGEWVWKWDAGVESNTEKEKGESSDAFKRACVNLGIGRFMYDLPIIRLNVTQHGERFNSKSNRKEPTYRPSKEKDNKQSILWNGDQLTTYINNNLPALAKMPQATLDRVMNKPDHYIVESSAIANTLNAGLLKCTDPTHFALMAQMMNAAPAEVAQRLASAFQQQLNTHKVVFDKQNKTYKKSA